MHRTHLVLTALFSASLLAQEPKKYGTIFKGDVDGLVRSIRQNLPESGGFGDGSCRQTAMVLTAMGHCHRFYSLADGPVVRGPIQHLFAQRKADGSFGDAETTAWVIAALDVMDPKVFAEDVRSSRNWLTRQSQGGRRLGFDAIVARIAQQDSPVAAGEAISNGMKRGAVANPVQALVELVACQSVARALDAGRDPLASGGPAWAQGQQRGFDFLMKQQENGVFMVATGAGKFPDTGLTGLGLAALQTKPKSLRSKGEQQTIDRGLQYLLKQQVDDGSFGQRNANYATCAAVLALAMAKDDAFKPSLQKAQKYILSIQNVESRGYAEGDRDYGSIGYGGDQRGDLSNMQFAIEALRNTELDAQDESLQKAVVFLQRTQNLKSVNDFEGRVRNEGEWAEVTSGDDGGAAYYPGNSPAGYVELPDGKQIPRSYGSMTYALLKTYTLAGLKADDPRVQAAVRWIESNWALDVNPGSDPRLGEKAKYQGLYYYYMVMAQALDVTGVDTLKIPSEEGDTTLDLEWRPLLRKHLMSTQNPDGSWLNDKNGRWWESKSVICSIYAMLAIERTQR